MIRRKILGISCLLLAILICVVGRGEDGGATGAILIGAIGIGLLRS